MEEWRYNELRSLNIMFSDDNMVPQVSIHNTSFYKGLFLTGSNSKSQTIMHYLQYFNADTFVMIDDREEHLEDIRQFCNKNSIKFIGILFIGILFIGLEKFKEIAKHDVVLLQKKHLIESAKWLEDEEAEKIIEQNLSTLSRSKL